MASGMSALQQQQIGRVALAFIALGEHRFDYFGSRRTQNPEIPRAAGRAEHGGAGRAGHGLARRGGAAALGEAWRDGGAPRARPLVFDLQGTEFDRPGSLVVSTSKGNPI